MIDIPTLETERLLLRPWRECDLDRYFLLRGDQVAAEFIGGAMSRDDTWRGIAMLLGHQVLRGYTIFALEEKATGTFIGYCGPWFPLGFPEPEIGWGLVPSNSGKGYATEAAKCALAFAFGPLGWTTAISLIAPENLPSIKVAKRLGARIDGTTKFRGRTCDIYAIRLRCRLRHRKHPTGDDPCQ
jgi:RimJ/RimL family protein N-acetyltransferase